MGKKLSADLARRGSPPSNDTASLSDDLVWEVAGIAAEIGKTPRQTHYMLENGHLPAKKIGGRWCSSRTALRTFFANLFVTEAA